MQGRMLSTGWIPEPGYPEGTQVDVTPPISGASTLESHP